MSFRRRALFLAGLFVAVSCSDAGNPIGPEGPGPVVPQPEDVLATLTCRVSVGSPEMVCAAPTPGVGAASGLIVGGVNGDYVRLTKIGHNVDADSMWFDVTLQNLIHQTMGTLDGVAPHADGVRIFFSVEPWMTAPGSVDVVPDGTHLFTAAGQPYYQYAGMLVDSAVSAPTTWKFKRKDTSDDPAPFVNGQNFEFTVRVAAAVKYPQGWIEITPDNPVIAEGEVVSLTAHIRDAFGRFPTSTPADSARWSSSDLSIVTVTEISDTTAQITGVDEGTAWVYAESRRNSVRKDSVLVTVNTAPLVPGGSTTAVTNVTVARPAPGLLAGATDNQSLSVVPGTVTSLRGGRVRVNADGSYRYLSAADSSGTDNFQYQVTDGTRTTTGTFTVNILPSNYWYVQAGATGGDGRDSIPFGTIAAAQAKAGPNDTIFVLESGTTLNEAVVLENGQGLVGAGIGSTVWFHMAPLDSVSVLAPGGMPGLTRTAAGPTVTVGQNNVIRGVGIDADAGAAIFAPAPFITLLIRETDVAPTGPALDLTTGTIDAVFGTLSALGSASTGISLTGVDGSVTAAGGAISITGAGGTAVSITGGVNVSYPGDVTQGTNNPLLAVANHTGTLTFSGALSAATGTGLQFNDADGSYNFTGSATLNGGDAGVDVTNGSAGTFVFGAGTAITNPTGTAFSVYGSSPVVTYNGNITQANNALLVDVSEQPGGTLTFQNGTLAATNGAGILLSNADGIVGFVGTTTLNGGDAGVDVVAGTGGSIEFAAGTSITNPSGPAFFASASVPSGMTYAGTISVNASRPVHINGGCGPIYGFSGSITSTGLGVLVENCTSGFVALNGTKTLSTGANQAVTLTANSGTTVSFGGGNLGITTTTGTGFGATGGGTVQVTGNNNTISTGTGTGLSLNGVSTGSNGVTFRSVTTGAAVNGIALNNLTGAGVTVSGDGATAGSGGSISGTTGHGVSITNMGALTIGVSLNYLNVSAGAGGNAAFFGSNFGPVGSSGIALSATGGPALSLSNGTYFGTHTTVNSSGSASTGVSLTNVVGSVSTTGGTIAGAAAGAAVSVNGGSVSGTIASTITQGNVTRPVVEILGGHNTGTLTFSGNVTATNGTGLQFTDADGTYTFTGTLNLAGGDAGIDIATGSSGTVNVTPAGANTAVLTSPSGTAISIVGGSADLSYSGNVTQANSQPLLSVTGGHTGDVAFPSGIVNASNGNGLQFDNADGTYDFDGTVTLQGGDAGIDITNGSGGTFTFPTTANIVSPSTGNLVSILNSAPTFTYPGAFTKANNNVTGILVSNNTGGSITFNGTGTKSISSGTAAAVNLANNGSASILFSGGGLSITSGTGNGLTATGSGTVQVTGANNTVSSTGGGTAVNIQNVTIGASGVSLLSVSASGGGGGIVLQNTGSGGLQVTGTSTHGSGGTVVNASGADGAVAGNGVYLDNAANVNLSWMNFSGHANHAVRGISVSNVTLTRLRITGTNGSNAGFDEGAVVFTNLTGSAAITSSYIEGGFEDNVRVANTSGTLNRLTMTSDTVGHNGTTGNDGVLLDASSTATMNVTVQNSRFTGSRSNNVHYVLNNNAAGDFVFTNNVLTNNHPAKLGSDFGINVGSTSNGAMTYAISGNSVRDAGGSGIEVSHLAGGSGAMTGSITGNTVGVAGAANSGSVAGSTIVAAIVGAGTTATHTTTITGNTLRQYTNYGIRLINRGTGNGYLNASVKTNNIAEPSPNAASFAAYSGIRAELGAASGPPADDGRTCLDISGNTLTQTGSSLQADLRVFARFGTRTSLLGLGQGGASAVPNTFLANQNTITVAPGGFGAVNATSTTAFQSTCPPV